MLTGCESQLANKSQVNNLFKDKISKKLEKAIEDNKLEVGPLWKKGNIILRYNRELSEKKLYYLEKEFSKNPHFKQLYIQQINDYIEKGYVKKL